MANPARHGLPWTTADYWDLLNCLHADQTLQQCCEKLHRSEAGVAPKARCFGWEFYLDNLESRDPESKPRCVGAVRPHFYATYKTWEEDRVKSRAKAEAAINTGKPITADEWKKQWLATPSTVKHFEDEYLNMRIAEEQFNGKLFRSATNRLSDMPLLTFMLSTPRDATEKYQRQGMKSLMFQELYGSQPSSKDDIGDALRYLYTAGTRSDKVEATINPTTTKETTMKSNITPESFKVTTRVTYVYNGQDLIFCDDVKVYSFIKEVEDQIKELQAIETSSAKKAEQISGLRVVAQQLASFLDNRQALHDAASKTSSTIPSLTAADSQELSNLRAELLRTQLELGQTQRQLQELRYALRSDTAPVPINPATR